MFKNKYHYWFNVHYRRIGLMIYLTLHIIQNKVSLQGLNDAKRQPTSVTVCSSCCHLAKDTQLSDALTIPDYGAGSFSSTFTLHLLSFYGFFFFTKWNYPESSYNCSYNVDHQGHVGEIKHYWLTIWLLITLTNWPIGFYGLLPFWEKFW